jgi:ribosomal protein S18 acetylase RimI-like enzyme
MTCCVDEDTIVGHDIWLTLLTKADEDTTVLMNIGTSKTSRQKGAATALVKSVIEAADREKVSIYLDTVSEGPAKGLFDKLGFEEAGRFEMDLSKYGGQGCHSHIGMIRWSWGRVDSCKSDDGLSKA